MSRPLPPPRPSIRRRPFAFRSWQRQASPLSRYALLAYVLVVIDASLYPFRGWRDLGLSPYAYLSADWYPHALGFDLIVNAVGYLPLGFIAGLALHPRLRGVAMVVVATLACAVLSVHLEALQSYLPTRVASTVDVLSNVAGGLIGALLAARFAHPLLDTGRLRMWRTRWFAGGASRGLVLLLVWFGALVYPDAFVLGMGGVLKAFDPSGSDLVATRFGLGDGGDPVTTAMRFQAAETMVACLALLGAGLLFENLLRPGLHGLRRLGLLAVFVALGVAVTALAHAFVFDAPTWEILTPGARTGIAIALAALPFALFLPWKARWVLGLLAIVAALLIVNVFPDNPYGAPVRLAWTRGKLLNFYGLASGVNLAWPFFAIAYFLRHRTAPSTAR